MSALVLPGTSLAYADFGRWVVMCGRPDRCSAAVGPDEGLRSFMPGFICPECGAPTQIVWPEPAMVQGVERLLMMRPHPKNRNWFPGETLIDLMQENALHGIFDSIDLPVGVSAFAVTETAIQVDALPDRQAVTAGGLR